MIKAILENIKIDKKDEKLLKKALSDSNLKKVRNSRTLRQKRLNIQKKIGLSERALTLLNSL
ncbi:hypothetical protein [Aliarcobacter butzleri]|uniref:hypothetical protein n=1 Tax=Aliarcobacter butzleri TaxID=28197 RepID=UPI001269D4DB|nr:hypothetical protein [Aliarcobacter butzleri]